MSHLFAKLIIISGIALAGCGDRSSSTSSSNSAPAGFDAAQKEKYNKLTPEGKAYVEREMKAYDNASKK